MKKRIMPHKGDNYSLLEELYRNGKISADEKNTFSLAVDRHKREWTRQEELFVGKLVVQQYSPLFLSRILGRSTAAITSRLQFIFGHTKWVNIVTMSPEARMILLHGFQQVHDIEYPLNETVPQISDLELFNFLLECGFDGTYSDDSGA